MLEPSLRPTARAVTAARIELSGLTPRHGAGAAAAGGRRGAARARAHLARSALRPPATPMTARRRRPAAARPATDQRCRAPTWRRRRRRRRAWWRRRTTRCCRCRTPTRPTQPGGARARGRRAPGGGVPLARVWAPALGGTRNGRRRRRRAAGGGLDLARSEVCEKARRKRKASQPIAAAGDTQRRARPVKDGDRRRCGGWPAGDARATGRRLSAQAAAGAGAHPAGAAAAAAGRDGARHQTCLRGRRHRAVPG